LRRAGAIPLAAIEDTLDLGIEALVDGIEWIPPGPSASGSFAVRRAA
jgi:hypothetical protein